MGRQIYREHTRSWYAAFLGLILALAVAAPAAAAELPPYEFDSFLSLTGDCSVSEADPVPDPGCPNPPHPAQPFDQPRAVAIDSFGNEYIATYAEGEDAKGRVDVFDDEGRFITEIAVPNAKSIAVDSEGELYVFDDAGKLVRYTPSTYEPEAGDIAYPASSVTVSTGSFLGAVAVDASNDHLFAVREGVITEYSSAEGGNKVQGTSAILGNWSNAIAVDGLRRRIYFSDCKNGSAECIIRVAEADAPYAEVEVVDGSTTPLGKFTAFSGRLGIAVDEEVGDFFVADLETAKAVYQFSEGYEYLSQIASSRFKPKGVNSIQIAVSNGTRDISGEACGYPVDPVPPPGDACNRHYLFVPVLARPGPVLAFSRPNQAPPVIEAVSTGGIGETEAQLRATIDPRGLETEYSFQITTQEAWEAETEKFENATTLPGGAIPAESLATEVNAFASGLDPGQTYRFRVVASNELGPAAEEGQNEAAFTTYDDASITPPSSCPNQEFLLGFSALLPDCRAYELVTPVETIGRPPRSLGFNVNAFTTLQASPTGGAVSYKIEGGSLPGSSGVGGFDGDLYVSTRSSSGWGAALAGPSGDETTVADLGSISPDQRYSFFTAREEGPLVIEGGHTQYLRYPDGHPELIGRGSEGTDPRATGKLITEGATHVIFETIGVDAVKLEPNAPPNGTRAVYDRTIDPGTGDEETHVVSLLPGDVTPAAGQSATYRGASKDGEGIAFTIGNKLYLRVGNVTTYEIGENVEFAGVSEGGERIFYVEGGDLEAFDTGSEAVVEFSTSGDVTPVNVATEGSRAYFVSPSVLDGANPEGDVAIPPASGQGTLGAKGTGTLSAAKGEGTLTLGSAEVTGVSTSEGTFEQGMQISGSGIPEGTTIKAVGAGTLTLSKAATQTGVKTLTAGSARVTGVSVSEGVFEKGAQISGSGIPAGTTIKAVGSGTLTLSKVATQPGSTSLAAGSMKANSVSTGEGVFQVGMNVTGTGIPAGTIITAVNEGAQTLTLSKEASASGAQPLSAFAQNLYLSEEGAISFVATVTARDVEGELPPNGAAFTDGLGLWTEVVTGQPAKDPSRLNPDGSVLLFQARAEITGYPASEFPQIYRYDSTEGRLHCISCIPTGAPPTGGASLENYTFDPFAPQPLSPDAFVTNLNPQGTRVFFDSTEALVFTDTDEVNDVYEWEAQGVGSCTRPEGCVYLISSGQSEGPNFLYAHSTTGDDVFFATGDALTSFDTGSAISIYDARVNGGFPEPKPQEPCVADGCRPSITPAPVFEKPRAGGDGDVRSKSKTCPKGKRKVKKNGNVRCVKKKKNKAKGGKAKKRAGANRGAGK